MRFFRVRLIETVKFEIIVSVLCAMLFYFNVLKQTVKICSLVMILCSLANIIRLIFDLTAYRRYSGAKVKIYYKTNFLVVLIIAAASSILAGFNIEPLFTWLFFPFKLLYFCFGVPKLLSAVALNVVFAVVTACIPAFVSPRKRSRNRKSVAKDKIL